MSTADRPNGAPQGRASLKEAVLSMDLLLLGVTLLLMGIGLMMVLSASGIMAEKFFGDKYHFFHRQILFAVAGTALMATVALAPRKRIYSLKYLLLFGVVFTLLAVLVTPLGLEINGARRWLKLGPFSLQPMEFAKVALVVYLAWFFSRKQELVKSFSVGVVPPFLVTGLMCLLLLLQPDFGGAAVLAMLLFLMCLAGGTRLVYLLLSLCLAGGGAWLLIVQSPYRSRRLLAFMDPFKDALDTGYQLVQSLYALGSGRIWGAGLGMGKQKLFFLPEAHNDFIMAVLGEELGFAGMVLVFAIVGVLLWRCFVITLRQEDLCDRLTAFGMTLILGLGAILNMAVVLGTAPPKGVPMPFLSYGGSHVLCAFLCVGLLLNLSRTAGGRNTAQGRAA
ncbi:MAG: putative lipid II flippase FtsW [Desulfovibrionaceae bacterium]|jgi:cell division protein FtsW|nr:putative lipid II flippase FtsW [Desulfovibrionaceae bacterium]